MTGSTGTPSDRMHLMLADPDLTGDLLAVGLALAVIIDSGITPWPTVNEIGCRVFGPDSRYADSRIHAVIRDDARAYRTPMRRTWTCNGPMIRRPGECGKHATNQAVIIDWSTGERRVLQACNRHRDWWEQTCRDNLAAKPDLVPLPPANSGGVLARYFPEIDWPQLWLAINPRWVEHPEREPEPDSEPATPKLTLHLGDAQASTTRKPPRRRLFAVPKPDTSPRLV